MNTADRPSLVDGSMAPVWDAVRARLERKGTDNRGRVRLPDLAPAARLALKSLTGRAVGKTVDLDALESGLIELGVGGDIVESLAALGHPVSAAPAQRRAAAARGRAARSAARETVAGWAEEWSAAWIDDVIRAGVLSDLSPLEAVDIVEGVRAVLDRVDVFVDGSSAGEMGRVDLAARLFGDSHALDTGTRREAATTRALRRKFGDLDPRELWSRGGAHLDLTSAPALTWRLPLHPDSVIGALTAASTTAGLPYHVTQFALATHPVELDPGSEQLEILVTENPRIVEAAAQRNHPGAVMSTNGNPSGAVLLLLQRLRTAGCRLRYHGDFDAAGLAICRRMHSIGLTPWRMTVTDYLDALADAARDGVRLAEDTGAVPPTPWDPQLHVAFAEHRRIVHEERLIALLLAGEPPTA